MLTREAIQPYVTLPGAFKTIRIGGWCLFALTVIVEGAIFFWAYQDLGWTSDLVPFGVIGSLGAVFIGVLAWWLSEQTREAERSYDFAERMIERLRQDEDWPFGSK